MVCDEREATQRRSLDCLGEAGIENREVQYSTNPTIGQLRHAEKKLEPQHSNEVNRTSSKRVQRSIQHKQLPLKTSKPPD